MGWVLPPVVRRGKPVCPGREAGCRASAAGPGMAHRRVPWDKRVNRGNPTQEGEQAGVAFLLVTFLWPRKEKSLASARRAGETPSRMESSCPAWRSHAQSCWRPLTLTLSRKGRGDQSETPSRAAPSCPAWRSHAQSCWRPLTLTLSRKGRGNCYRGRLRFANRPYWFRGWWEAPVEDSVLVSCMAQPCRYRITA
ncbi:hypothetical protein M2366_000323 [Aeromonas sp. BIGb0405]|nr:hypothetical protein [Aeromonas sp. BIGb0405]